MDIKNFTVRQPKTAAGVYIFFDVSFLLMYLMLLNDLDNRNNIQAMLMMIPFLLIFLTLTIMWFRWKITIKDDQITVRPWLGRTKTFTFDYITKLKHVSQSTQFATDIECFTAYNGSRVLFTVTSSCPNAIVIVALCKVKGVEIEWKTKEYGEYIDKRTEEFRNAIREEQEREKNKKEHGEGYYEV